MNRPFHIPSIKTRVEQIDSPDENGLQPRHAAGSKYWELGAAAFQQDVLIEECPFSPGEEQDDWLRGWMAAELVTFSTDGNNAI